MEKYGDNLLAATRLVAGFFYVGPTLAIDSSNSTSQSICSLGKQRKFHRPVPERTGFLGFRRSYHDVRQAIGRQKRTTSFSMGQRVVRCISSFFCCFTSSSFVDFVWKLAESAFQPISCDYVTLFFRVNQDLIGSDGKLLIQKWVRGKFFIARLVILSCQIG